MVSMLQQLKSPLPTVVSFRSSRPTVREAEEADIPYPLD
jgi:hypothetical protein